MLSGNRLCVALLLAFVLVLPGGTAWSNPPGDGDDRFQDDRNQDDRNQDDRNQDDRNQDDRNQDDRNQDDRNQDDRNQDDRNQDDRNQDDAVADEDRMPIEIVPPVRSKPTPVPAGDLPIDPGWDDISQTTPDPGKGGTPDADQARPPAGGTPRPRVPRHGPPGRGPRGEPKWELVDGANQTGSKADREALAKEIFGTGVGFSDQDLREATREEKADILIWLNSAVTREKEFAKNLDRTRLKIQRKKKRLSQMSLGELYKERTGGWFDHQKDADDMRVTMDFKRFLQDRAFRRGRRPDNIYVHLLMDVDHLIMLAAPAYGVTISKEEIKSVKKVEAKFRDTDKKGAFQFPASYVMGLMLDRGHLKSSMRRQIARRPDGKGGSRPPYTQDPIFEYPEEEWGKGGKGSTDVDLGGGKPGRRGGRPRSPGRDDEFFEDGDVRSGRGKGGIDPDTRRTFRDLANAGVGVLDANSRYDRDREMNEEQWRRENERLNAPQAPGSTENEAELARAIGDADQILEDVRGRQRQVVEMISQWRTTQDPVGKQSIEQSIRTAVYGSNSQQPDPNSLMGLMKSQKLRGALAYAANSARSQNPAFRSAHNRIFAEGGKLDRVQRTQHEVIASFLTDRDQDRRQKGDPNNPLARDPNTGLPIDPNTGRPIDPQTGRPLDPNTGLPVDPNNPSGPRAPVSQNGNPLPGGGNAQPSSDPNQRLQQIATAMTDPNLTPAERANLQAEQQRLQQQVAAQQQQAAAAAAAAANPAATAATAQGPKAPMSAADAEAAAKAKMPQVSNSYGVSPNILTDAELQAAAAPAMQAQLATWNKELAAKGVTVNEFLQYSGKGVTSTGRAPGDHWQTWIQRVPAIKEAMAKAASEAYAKKLKELTDAELAKAPQAPPAAVTPPQNPPSTATPLPSQSGGPTAGAIIEPR